MVVLYVGETKTPFYVHEDILFNASSVFKAGFDREFKEAIERSMSLPEDNVDDVQRLIQWLYQKKFDLPSYEKVHGAKDPHWMSLAKLYIFADKFAVAGLKNGIIDKLFEMKQKGHSAPGLEVITHVYENTTRASSLRKLLVANLAYHCDLKFFSGQEAYDQLVRMPEFTTEWGILLSQRLATNQSSPYDLAKTKLYDDGGHKASQTSAKK